MKPRLGLLAVLGAIAAFLVFWGGSAAAEDDPNSTAIAGGKLAPPASGVTSFGMANRGTRITECPQAGITRGQPKPLDRREIDQVERLSERGDDKRANQDYSCFPQNETSIAINPKNLRNILGTQNDYRTLSRQGFDASTNRGNQFYDAELPPLSVPNGDILDASGDPVSVFDRAGIAYSSSINFNRTDDENGITVQRSTNGGFTWTRPCVPIGATDAAAVCGAPGDPRQPGDGVVTYFDDPDAVLNDSEPFDDKEFMAAGPRPTGVAPQCFNPVSRTARPCDPEVVGVDRLYVTWTRFLVGVGLFGFTANIYLSYSDDEARSWSPPKVISGSAPFCGFSVPANSCDINQFSVPTVHPTTGLLGVAFENFNTPDENQYLFVRSSDGSATFDGPYFITPVFDLNYPVAGIERPDCTMRGQQAGREVLTNTCFRVNAGGNVVVDKRAGDFADDFYLVMSDNRNGTRGSSNTDVFFFKSTNGGATWIGPTRVNNDRSDLGGVLRDSATNGNFGNDQWFPWTDVSGRGVLAVGYHDRRLDTDSTAIEWPTSRTRPGNYLAWFWGSGCRITQTATVTGGTTIPAGARECLAPGAAVIPQPTGLVDPPDGAVPGQGPTYLGPFRNQLVSDVPHNLDYSFRAGIFMGDYNAVAYPNLPGGSGGGGDDDDEDEGGEGGGGQALAFWTDSRNGRGSGSPSSPQPGRNPACEQADVFIDYWNPLASGPMSSSVPQEPFLVTPCPSDAVDKRDRNSGDD